MRVVRSPDEIEAAYERASSEARAAFGSPEVYLERFLPQARHIEVQIAGDASGEISHFWERDCSLQRRHQKIVEFAPSPTLPPDTRARILEAAVKLGRESRYTSLGTFEFLVDAASGDDTSFAFLEANARLQVEHTVTEEVTGVDLVQLQLRLASVANHSRELGLLQKPASRHTGARIRNPGAGEHGDDAARTGRRSHRRGGTLTAFEPPSGPGIRVDTFGYAGYHDEPALRLIAGQANRATRRPAEFEDVLRRGYRALCGVPNRGCLDQHPAPAACCSITPRYCAGPRRSTRATSTTTWRSWWPACGAERRTLLFSAPLRSRLPSTESGRALAGVEGGSASNPLAVLAHGQAARDERLATGAREFVRRPSQGATAPAPDGTVRGQHARFRAPS